MNLADTMMPGSGPGATEALLAQLAREERVRAALGTLLPQLVGGDDAPVLAEELVVRTRALLAALAADLLRDGGEDLSAALAAALGARPAVLAHCHALALEGRVAERLAGAGLDPVLSPLIEARMAGDAETAALAMNALAAQARFVSRQRRMEAVAAELPAEAMHEALVALADAMGPGGNEAAARRRADYDEGRTRLAQLARLVLGAASDEGALLDPARAGFALFATALAQRAGVPREEAVLAGAAGQDLRLGLLLRAAGIPAEAARSAVALIHPDSALPGDWLDLPAARAAALLAGAEA
ncbi:hypothetical protein ACFOD9_08405 [Novosphingobium bradum]|uniref:DUF2336 domain-containing protein n=1 Tax=Novosphingobium bradum TaxID=1737444 RepID=A0ABV7INK6_9SPHN